MSDPDIERKLKKEQAQKDTSEYLQMKNSALLEKMIYVSSKPPEHDLQKNTSDEINVRFAALLINLVKQADESTQRIISLTKELKYLTLGIVFLTIVLLFIGAAQISLELRQKSTQPPIHQNKKNQYTNQGSHINVIPKIKKDPIQGKVVEVSKPIKKIIKHEKPPSNQVLKPTL